MATTMDLPDCPIGAYSVIAHCLVEGALPQGLLTGSAGVSKQLAKLGNRFARRWISHVSVMLKVLEKKQ